MLFRDAMNFAGKAVRHPRNGETPIGTVTQWNTFECKVHYP